jgi:transposase InsO family protein
MNSFDPKYMELKELKLLAILAKTKKVKDVAEELSLSRQTIHKLLSRYKRYGIDGLLPQKRKTGTGGLNRTNPVIEQLVIQTAKKNWESGVLELSDILQLEHNITLNASTIWRILKRNDVRYTSSYPNTRMKWKKKLYAHDTPGMELQMDTTYPFGYKQGKVVYTIIDDASRWVFAYSYETASAVNTLDFIQKVLSQAPFTIQKIRSDNGKEFIARIVKALLKERSIEYRQNTPYCPEENGKIERFHGTFKRKCFRFGGIYPKTSLEEMQYKITLFLMYYNNRRRHRGLGMDGMTPAEKLESCKV